jgi:AsmA protein
MKVVKWLLIVGAGLFLLVLAALLIVPRFMDGQKYKPHIEKKVLEATGRPFRIGGRLEFSLFPWVGVALSDLHLKNPPGFTEEDCLSIHSFEVRVKLLPLFSRDVQVKRFVVEGLRVAFEKSVAGQGNWDGMGSVSEEVPGKQGGNENTTEVGLLEGLPIDSLAVGECAVKNAFFVYIDEAAGVRKEISEVTLRLEDVSLDRPIHLALAGKAMACPFSLEGEVGPLGKEIGKGSIPLRLAVGATKEVNMRLEGHLTDPVRSPQFDLALHVSAFSPRKLLAALDRTFPFATADPEALTFVALEAKLKGNRDNAWISDGLLDLDASKVVFSGRIQDYAAPQVSFDLSLNKIDVDRYVPSQGKDRALEEKKRGNGLSGQEKKTDYASLQGIVLDGAIRVAEMKAYGARLHKLLVKVWAKDGQLRLDPVTCKLYEGSLSAKGGLDLGNGVPKSTVELRGKGIEVAPLVQDLLKKGFLKGDIHAEMAIQMEGDTPQAIKRTLNGKGDLVFKDGAIVGIDLAQMARNVKAAFGLAPLGEKKPRTDFSELHVPFVVTNGIVNTTKTTLTSPGLRLTASGKADLVTEALGFRVEPTFVATLKGQGDTKERSGFMVPVVVGGSFKAPQFRPDLESVIRKGIEDKLPQASDLIKALPGQSKENGDEGSLEHKARDLLRELPLGR